MNPIRNYKRWRHSKGYGVHSPYAFRLVNDVVRPGRYGYYAYLNIERHLKGGELSDYRLQRVIRFAIRLSVFLKAKRIAGMGMASRLAELTAKSLELPFLYLGDACCKWEEGDFVISGSYPAGKDKALYKRDFAKILTSTQQSHIPVFAVNPDRIERNLLEQPLLNGLLLNDKNGLIMIPRREMQYVSYEIKLRF